MKALSDKKIRKSIINIVKTCLPDSKVILFGSRVNNLNRENSDYDIAILWKNKIPSNIYFDIYEKLDDLYTLKTIDLVDFHNLDEDFREIVKKQGVIVYDGTMQEPVEKVQTLHKKIK